MQIRLAQYQFALDEPYSAGHVLTLGEAQALNALRAENIRNNMTKQYMNAAIHDAQGELLTPEQLIAAQAWLDDYARTYAFGQRKQQHRKSPLEQAIEEVAQEQALEQASAIGRALTPHELAEAVIQLSTMDTVQQEARARVAERKRIAEAALSDLL